MHLLSTFYDSKVSICLRTNRGRIVTIFQIAKLFLNDVLKSAIILTAAVNTYRKTGILPLNPNVFSDFGFTLSKTTERLMSN